MAEVLAVETPRRFPTPAAGPSALELRLAALEAGPWVPLQVGAKFANYGEGHQPVGWRKEGSRIFLRGELKATVAYPGGVAEPVFTLPPEAQPPANVEITTNIYTTETKALAVQIMGRESPWAGVAWCGALAINTALSIDGLDWNIS
jgi:hypothetical protein